MVLIVVLMLWLQTTDSILNRYTESVGGKTAVERITSRVTKGSIVTTAGSMPYTVYQKCRIDFLSALTLSKATARTDSTERYRDPFYFFARKDLICPFCVLFLKDSTSIWTAWPSLFGKGGLLEH